MIIDDTELKRKKKEKKKGTNREEKFSVAIIHF